jgi:hypothetical protein
MFENPSKLPPDTKIYLFEADFTGNNRKSVFITDDRSCISPSGNYSWTVYYPSGHGQYELVDDAIVASLSGPGYIGYIREIKRYGVLRGSKNSVIAEYLDHGAIASENIAQIPGEEDADRFPDYFPAKGWDYKIKTYTLGQLSHKYGALTSSASSTPPPK